ncbi:glycosyltransferase [Erythrobacter cryptus]|uniref:glycosyltransferase n=1 Tax=Erythrobacter cryptus TaxID=196588 RepID=UPI00040E0346|nr:glycosyltransferase [Erythrobacter cryptus]
MLSLTILIPTYNEEAALPATLAALDALDPAPDEVLVVDGGSSDATCAIARAAGVICIVAPRKGRGAQINHGVAAAKGTIVCVLHADTILPRDAVALMRAAMADPATALAGFMPRFVGARGTRWGSTFHNIIKTWYIPALFCPRLFLRGVRLLFGDHAMFFRRDDFLRLGGCDERAPVLEEAGLCLAFARIGRIRLLPRWVLTSDRRIAAWGSWRANWIYFKVSALWALGAREELAAHYPDIR